MASFRRTQAPGIQDRLLPYSNGGGGAAAAAAAGGGRSGHPSAAGGLASLLFAAASSMRRLFVGRPSRRANPGPWRRYFLRFLLCFLVGFLAGVFPFAGLDDSALGHIDFEFDSVRPPPSADHVDLPRRDLAGVVRGGSGEIGIGRAGVDVRVAASGELKAKTEDPPEERNAAPKKLLIIVTPTYNRALQAYYLNRLGQTLRLVPQPLLWIVVEMKSASPETADILRRSGVMYRHVVCRKKDATRIKDRGVHQRNTALQHIEKHRLNGIVYFADDDNIYSLELFEHLREIRRFGTWPVAMLAQGKNKAILEGPVCNGSQVIGWHTNEKSKRLRRFHVDMSGFAFNSTILWDPMRWNRTNSDAMRQLDTVNEGFQETTFIEQIVEDESQMEGLPSDCSKIMNWHLHIEAGNLIYPKGWEVSTHLDSIIRLK